MGHLSIASFLSITHYSARMPAILAEKQIPRYLKSVHIRDNTEWKLSINRRLQSSTLYSSSLNIQYINLFPITRQFPNICVIYIKELRDKIERKRRRQLLFLILTLNKKN